jgi:hypothetical protein
MELFCAEKVSNRFSQLLTFFRKTLIFCRRWRPMDSCLSGIFFASFFAAAILEALTLTNSHF